MVDPNMPACAESDNSATPPRRRAPSADRFPITSADAALIKGMIKRGDLQSDIAAYFGCNGSRISEINTGHSHAEVTIAPEHILPPAGPYLIGRSSVKARQTLVALGELIADCLAELDAVEGLGN